jgi:hypothetical protein
VAFIVESAETTLSTRNAMAVSVNVTRVLRLTITKSVTFTSVVLSKEDMKVAMNAKNYPVQSSLDSVLTPCGRAIHQSRRIFEDEKLLGLRSGLKSREKSSVTRKT